MGKNNTSLVRILIFIFLFTFQSAFALDSIDESHTNNASFPNDDVLGDVNCDGLVTPDDARIVYKWLVGLGPEGDCMQCADVGPYGIPDGEISEQDVNDIFQAYMMGGMILGGIGDASCNIPPVPREVEKVAVLLVTFQDFQCLTLSKEYIQNRLFSASSEYKRTLTKFFFDVSYGRAWFEGTVFDWKTLPFNISIPISQKDANQIIDLAIQFHDPDVDFGLFDRISVVPCYFNGSIAFAGTKTIQTDEGEFTIPMTFFSLDENDAFLNSTFHEHGHNYGLSHIPDWLCDPPELYQGETCGPFLGEYANPYDIMGGGYGHLSAPQKYYLGWIDENDAPIISEDGTYFLAPLDCGPSTRQNAECQKALIAGKRSFRVPRNEFEHYFIEYRKGIGFDGIYPRKTNDYPAALITFDDDLNMVKSNGCRPHTVYVSPPQQTDSNSTSHRPEYQLTHPFDHYNLRPDQTFFDPDAGVKITNLGEEADGTLALSIDFVTPSKKPDLLINSARTIPSQVKAGEPFIFQFEVINEGSAKSSTSHLSLEEIVAIVPSQAATPGCVFSDQGGEPVPELLPGESVDISLNCKAADSGHFSIYVVVDVLEEILESKDWTFNMIDPSTSNNVLLYNIVIDKK